MQITLVTEISIALEEDFPYLMIQMIGVHLFQYTSIVSIVNIIFEI